MPTLLARVGATIPVGLDGRDISKTLLPSESLEARPVRSQAAALPGVLQRRTVDPRTDMAEVVISGDLRVLMTANKVIRSERRVRGSQVEINSNSPAVNALVSWRNAADESRRTGKGERVKLSEEAIQQLQSEGYW